MSENDFKECAFIYREMRFFTFQEFYENCEAIKWLYKRCLGKLGKMFYRWYVYANIHTTTTQKNKIWDYLNDYVEKPTLSLYRDKKIEE